MQTGAVAVGIYGFRMLGRASSCSAGRQAGSCRIWALILGWEWKRPPKALSGSATHTHTHTLNCVCVRLSPSSGSAGSSGTVSAGCEGRANMPTSGTHVTKHNTDTRHTRHGALSSPMDISARARGPCACSRASAHTTQQPARRWPEAASPPCEAPSRRSGCLRQSVAPKARARQAGGAHEPAAELRSASHALVALRPSAKRRSRGSEPEGGRSGSFAAVEEQEVASTSL